MSGGLWRPRVQGGTPPLARCCMSGGGELAAPLRWGVTWERPEWRALKEGKKAGRWGMKGMATTLTLAAGYSRWGGGSITGVCLFGSDPTHLLGGDAGGDVDGRRGWEAVEAAAEDPAWGVLAEVGLPPRGAAAGVAARPPSPPCPCQPRAAAGCSFLFFFDGAVSVHILGYGVAGRGGAAVVAPSASGGLQGGHVVVEGREGG